MDVETIFVNLKVVSQVPARSRLNTHGTLFYIEEDTLWAAVFRFFRGDNRRETIKHLEALLAAVQECSKQHPDEKQRLLAHVEAAKKGLLNLKQTYRDDLTMIASIDRLLDKTEGF